MAVSFQIHLQDQVGQRIRVREYCLPQSVRLEDEVDSWPRKFCIAIEPADQDTNAALIQFLKHRGLSSWSLHAEMAGYGLRFNGDGCEGAFTFGLLVEDLKLAPGPFTVQLTHHSSPTVTVTVLSDPRTVRLLGPLSPDVQRVLGASTLEGQPGLDWLANPAIRDSRRACLLNIMAKLSGTPTPEDPLIRLVQRLFVASPDRIYAAVDPTLHLRLQALVDADLWSHEGSPESPCHQRLIEETLAHHLVSDCAGYQLDSYRQRTNPSVQIVVAVPPASDGPYFADIDIDLANPFMDLQSLLVHMSEVASGEVTDHLDMWQQLQSDPGVRPYLGYEVHRV
jgi:hypothetical protein